MNKYNVKVDNQIHKIKVDSLLPIRFANTILSQSPRTCFAVLVCKMFNNEMMLTDFEDINK